MVVMKCFKYLDVISTLAFNIKGGRVQNMPMDEDAMFKALLKNKPQPKQMVQAPEIKEVKETVQPVRPAPPARPPSYASKGSEDAMYKALLHNRPPAPVQRPPARVEPRSEPVQAAPYVAPVHHEPVVVTQVSPSQEVDLGPVVNSIKDLTASVNQVHSLLKTFILPVVVLTLLVALAIIVKINI